ncbi:MAG: GNAT family N-acetyltransferase [Candidatus Saccharibacteria bacterium]|nr:GNAT family N-acetyltransferase [Candidatus Saccharibacteria bacterium]
MTEYKDSPKPTPEKLTKELAEKFADQLTALANLIPGVEYTTDDILADTKGDRVLLDKWEHSLVLLENGEPIAMVMGYERASEGNEQYPTDTLYVCELAVKELHQRRGIARELLKAFFERNNDIGMKNTEIPLNYSIQTNSAEWNQYVIDLYKSFGFKERSTKEYPNRVDVVLGVSSKNLLI